LYRLRHLIMLHRNKSLEASFHLNHERNVAMNETNFWTQSAEAMELTIEGNRLIAREVADLARNLWNRMGRGLVAMLSAEHRHLPPI
jgi:hypothetical protein